MIYLIKVLYYLPGTLNNFVLINLTRGSIKRIFPPQAVAETYLHINDRITVCTQITHSIARADESATFDQALTYSALTRDGRFGSKKGRIGPMMSQLY